ncbi:MAG: DUF1735 domain-containing protein [Muribaculaceae bacterium]|nr:DUF1735 domain-containing protein [Muribaculaceae bacterium]MDE6793808.1 DUF1735 domain-containing protein [Muribaculaceae bacterium]
MKKSIFSIFALGVLLAGCHNSDVDYPDFEYQTISFAYPNPIRTITLGYEADVDNSNDNAHKFEIKAVLGGVNENRADHSVTFRVANELCDGLYFENGEPVLAMPESYYTLSTDRMVIKKGDVLGGVEVQLTDAYFADPKSIDVNYVLPILLVNSADSILSGKAKDGVENPDRRNADDWSIQPKDFTLYAVKYKNKYDGCWLSKGTDVIDDNGEVRTDDRNVEYWEKASLRYLKSKSLNQVVYTKEYDMPIINKKGKKDEVHIVCDLLLDITDDGNITITSLSDGVTASGSGTWKELGEPKAFGDKDRDLMKLNYTLRFEYMIHEPKKTMAYYELKCDESMVLRDRQNKQEWFNYVLE